MSTAQKGFSDPVEPIGLVVVNYGSHELLANNLDRWADDAPVRVVVVDNYSSGAERTAVTTLAADRGWTLVGLPDNLGFSHGVNVGVARAKQLGCACVLLLNPDANASRDVVLELRRQVLAEPDALVSPVVLDSSGVVVFNGSEIDPRSGHLFRAEVASADATSWPWLSAACLALHVDLFDRLGGFDESYFLYWEDVDFSRRAAVAGARLIVREDLEALHDEGQTQGLRIGNAKSYGYYYYNCRNRLLFGVRNLNRRQLLSWTLRTPAQSWAILLRGGRRQLLHSRAPLKAVTLGSLAGIGLAVRGLVRGSKPSPSTALQVFYSRDLDTAEWAERHRRGEVPDVWPYGLDHLGGELSAERPSAPTTRLDQKVIRKLAGPSYDWAAHAPHYTNALCWDERIGVPVALTKRRGRVATGVIWLTEPDRPAHRADWITRRALGRCDAVWTLSTAQLEPLQTAWGVEPARTHYVPFGIDSDFWVPASEDAQPPGATILVVGNDRHRDHPVAIEAVRLAQSSVPLARLSLLSRQAFDVAPALGTREENVGHDELRRRYHDAAVVALAMTPNLHCSGITAALEAMACARPLVVSATPGMEDYIQDGVTGVLVAPGDADAMAEAIVSLLKDPAAADEMGRAARRAVEQRFTTRHLAQRLDALLN